MVIRDVSELEPGMVVIQDVLNNFDTVVISAGTELTTGMIMNLQTLDIDFVFIEGEEAVIEVDPEYLAGNNTKTELEVKKQEVSRREKFEVGVQYYKEMYKTVSDGGTVNHLEVFEVVKELVQEFYRYDDIFSVLKKMKSGEDYEYTHTTSMSIISVLLGKWLKLPHQKIYLLAQAAYLSDIGKAMLPADLLNKSGDLSIDEQMILQSHVMMTQDILERSGGFSGEIVHIAATHHERLNGTGYPYKMEKDGINQLTRIVAVADTYHALLSKRPYREAYSIFEATEMLWNMSYNELDPGVIERLVKFITSFWVGGEVVLSNGMKGEVIMANQYDKFRPLVKVDTGFIDLSRDRSCRIVDVVHNTN